MFNDIENLKIENIHMGTSKKSGKVLFRKAASFVLRTAGSAEYVFPDFSFSTRADDIIFLPNGTTYDFKILSDTPCNYVAIRFEGDFSKTSPFLYSIENFPEAALLKNNLSDMWKFGGSAEHYQCYSVVYNLLAYMKNTEKLTYIDKKHFNVIAPAVSYLKDHIYDSNLKIETLISISGVSGTYFYKTFQANYSMSPQKYILTKRLSQAKSILDSGDFDSISEIADLVGYNDSLYFSRVFKNKYGISPLNYAKQISMNNQ